MLQVQRKWRLRNTLVLFILLARGQIGQKAKRYEAINSATTLLPNMEMLLGDWGGAGGEMRVVLGGGGGGRGPASRQYLHRLSPVFASSSCPFGC